MKTQQISASIIKSYNQLSLMAEANIKNASGITVTKFKEVMACIVKNCEFFSVTNPVTSICRLNLIKI